MSKYTLEQIKNHGSAIQSHLSGQVIEQLNETSGKFEISEKPLFLKDDVYRVHENSKILYTNSLGEVFTGQDKEDKIKAYYFSFDTCTVDDTDFHTLTIDDYAAAENCTEITKSIVSALELAIKHYKEKY